ncbi:hypothetical protein BH09MYX1_BH09MYX1_16610 [soil metagenome]
MNLSVSEKPLAPLPVPPVAVPNAARWIAEAERLNRRYQIEIVEAIGLCPWAERARVDGSYRAHVLLQSESHVEPTLQAIDEINAETEIEVAVLVYPRLALSRTEFERFVARIRQADVPRHTLGCVPFVFAAFHPDAVVDASGPDRLVPFIRRTPDPTIQILRSSTLERVRSGTPQGTQFLDPKSFELDPPKQTVPLRERISRANFATIDRLGVAELVRRLDAIASDRKRTYLELEGLVDASATPEPQSP